MERFFEKVHKLPAGGCWEWTASVNAGGYGCFNYKGKVILAHRASWMIHNGEIPKGEGHHGICVLHKCDNARCVNPDHLFLGTQKENIHDMEKKGRSRHVGGENHHMYGNGKIVTGDKNPNYDGTAYTFIHKANGWVIRCTRAYLCDIFTLNKGNLSSMIAGKLKTSGGWSLQNG